MYAATFAVEAGQQSAEGLGPVALQGEEVLELPDYPLYELAFARHPTPGLRPGQTKVMDNLSAHKGGRVKEIVEGLRAPLPAVLLARPQPHRAGVFDAEGRLPRISN